MLRCWQNYPHETRPLVLKKLCRGEVWARGGLNKRTRGRVRSSHKKTNLTKLLFATRRKLKYENHKPTSKTFLCCAPIHLFANVHFRYLLSVPNDHAYYLVNVFYGFFWQQGPGTFWCRKMMIAGTNRSMLLLAFVFAGWCFMPPLWLTLGAVLLLGLTKSM